MAQSNKIIKDFENEIVAVINSSSLPIELIRLVLYQIYTDVKVLAEQTIYSESNSEAHTFETDIGGDGGGESIQQD